MPKLSVVCRNLGTRSSVRPKKIRSSHLSTFFSFHLSHFQDYFNCAGCWSLDDNVQNKRPLRQPASQGWRRSRSSCEEPAIYAIVNIDMINAKHRFNLIIWSDDYDTEQTLISPPDKLSVSSPRPSWRLRWSHCGRQTPGQLQLVSQWHYCCVITITVSIFALFVFDIIALKDQENFKTTSSAGTISSSSSSSALEEKIRVFLNV